MLKFSFCKRPSLEDRVETLERQMEELQNNHAAMLRGKDRPRTHFSAPETKVTRPLETKAL